VPEAAPVVIVSPLGRVRVDAEKLVMTGAALKLKAELEKHHDSMVTVRPVEDKMVSLSLSLSLSFSLPFTHHTRAMTLSRMHTHSLTYSHTLAHTYTQDSLLERESRRRRESV
jgi:hypothetical protein